VNNGGGEQFAISNDQLAMDYQFSISNDAANNRQLLIATPSPIANRQSLIAYCYLFIANRRFA
jgi:hypothetical protein